MAKQNFVFLSDYEVMFQKDEEIDYQKQFLELYNIDGLVDHMESRSWHLVLGCLAVNGLVEAENIGFVLHSYVKLWVFVDRTFHIVHITDALLELIS